MCVAKTKALINCLSRKNKGVDQLCSYSSQSSCHILFLVVLSTFHCHCHIFHCHHYENLSKQYIENVFISKN